MTSIKSLLLNNNQKEFYSVEVTPKDTFDNVDLSQLPVAPLFVSTTWIGDGNLKYESLNKSPALKIANNLMKNGVSVLTHVSCYKLKEVDLDEILKTAVNLFPLKGDAVENEERQVYHSSLELIRAVRAKKGNHVTLFTSAYPKVYENVEEEQREMGVLKTKVEAGADAIITQVVYESDVFTKFVGTCRKYGIQIPIHCGVYAPVTFSGLKRMEELTRQSVPETLMSEYKMFENDEQLFKEFAVETTVKLVRDVLKQNKGNGVFGVHFFTMNNFEQVSRVLKQLELK